MVRTGSSEEEIARLFATLNHPAQAFHQFRELIQHATALEQAEVPQHLQDLIAEMNSGTLLVFDGVAEFAHTRKGTRPGDPLADILFNFVAVKFSNWSRTA